MTEETLTHQTFKDFEHITKLSVPGPKPDLCASLNDCIRRSKGELIVILQDYTRIAPDGLQKCWDRYQEDPEAGWTFALQKTDDWQNITKSDWRLDRPNGAYISWNEWETDFACIPKKAILDVGGWDEDFDSGFSWDNVEIAYRMFKSGWGFRVDNKNRALAWDHDEHIPHPYRHKPNRDLWIGKKYEIEQGKVKMPYLD